MSMDVTKTICSILMAITGLFVVKKFSGSAENVFKLKSFALMLFLIALPAVIHDLSYSYISSILNYVITIVTYKYVLNIGYIKSTLSCTIMHILLIIVDLASMYILSTFVSADTFRNAWYITLIFNILFAFILILISYKTRLGNIISNAINKIENRKGTKMAFFFILIIIGMSIVLYLVNESIDISSIFTTNLAIFIILFLLVIILFTERNSYDKLSMEYDNLFNYVGVFEEWIEKEKFIRHEYKNQLAVLRNMTKQKSIKDKIDSIVDDMINIDDNIVNELGDLPNGGLKGLLYYKITVAKNKNINVEINVGNKVKSLFKKLDEEKNKVLSKVIGVYLDNAIEAAVQSNKKIISIEIYNLDSKLNIVISNSFKGKIDIVKMNQKGVSTKGEGRGNGLYYASKLLNKNNWLITEPKIIKDFYINKTIIS